jgi:hypothetical protein
MAARKRTLFPVAPRLNAVALQKRRKQRIIESQEEEDMSSILVARGTIAHAALLTLPGTPVTLVAAPGANLALLVQSVTLWSSIEQGYLGIDDTEADLYVGWPNTAHAAGTLVNRSSPSLSDVTDFLSDSKIVQLPGGNRSTTIGAAAVDAAGPLMSAWELDATHVTNEALLLRLNNVGDPAPLTGGHASNKVYYEVLYRLLSLDPADYA